MKTRRFILLALLSVASLSNKALAVDPLPPELENAPLEKKAEWWQRTSTESGQLRAKVARERYDKAVDNKNQILAHMAEAAAETRARVEEKVNGSTSMLTADANDPNETPTWSIYTLMAGILVGGIAFIQRNMRQAEDPALS